MVGLPLHLRTREILRRLANSCGGFVAIDKDTALRIKPLWVRVLVKMKEKVLVESRSYEL